MRWTMTVFCAVYVLHVLLCIDADAVEEDANAMSAGTTPSACGMCRDNGVCDHAYKGSPGHFCHTIWWSDDKPCCCPQGYACGSAPAECRCQKEEATSLLLKFAWPLFILTVFVVLACIEACEKWNEDDGEEERSSWCTLFWGALGSICSDVSARQYRRRRYHHHHHASLNGDDGLVYGTAIATAGASYEFNGDTGEDLEFGADADSNTGWRVSEFAGDSGDTTSYDTGSSFAGDS